MVPEGQEASEPHDSAPTWCALVPHPTLELTLQRSCVWRQDLQGGEG